MPYNCYRCFGQLYRKYVHRDPLKISQRPDGVKNKVLTCLPRLSSLA